MTMQTRMPSRSSQRNGTGGSDRKLADHAIAAANSANGNANSVWLKRISSSRRRSMVGGDGLEGDRTFFDRKRPKNEPVPGLMRRNPYSLISNPSSLIPNLLFSPHRSINELAMPNWSQIRETTKSTRSPISFTPW